MPDPQIAVVRKQHLSQAGLKASEQALDTVTEKANDHPVSPKDHIHKPADHPASTSWLSSILPTATLNGLESYYHLGNYVYDRQTNEKSWESMSVYVRLGMHILYYASYSEDYLEWPSTKAILKWQSEKMGRQYDAPESVAHIQPFIDSFSLQSSMAEMVQPDPKKYKTFNEFFAREIKPEARPIDEPGNPLMTISPADCRLTAFPTVDLATKYWIKGFGFTLERLLGSADLAKTFDGGSIVIARLAPQDYHRWHSPVDGTVTGVTEIPGTYHTVNPQAINEEGTVDVFCENRRSVMTLEREPTKSPVAIIAVGAMLVGSIKYVNGTNQKGTSVKRGQCLGAFYYGGSTVIVLYPKGEVHLDDDLVRHSTTAGGPCETLVKVGWRTGVKPLA